MRVVTLVALAVCATVAMFARCDGASLRHMAVPEEDEDFQPRLYREYRAMRRRARADDSFDDYGHLRFGRSDD